ncbi:hypothetical protein COV53_01265 [Candidatus Gottesmanbacteria bacterium CG11_big_fil_rev_8_21_14_0_20_37_11]|uniref:Uncharacterized protein n=1 Tax=Candidatus Gottesmanbacteria bacterium CG11_big_fil_rev_8_21_14_0_20_37_11 TaxID=1974575 RepID=A0A2H0NIU9_9BACT|nr:MAG: hypothetical protein COV53_01265 [Candidatus Gottesmanbacteria bacterium CG11_big_fil_rev_8_21_14_0_20_37_11]
MHSSQFWGEGAGGVANLLHQPHRSQVGLPGAEVGVPVTPANTILGRKAITKIKVDNTTPSLVSPGISLSV